MLFLLALGVAVVAFFAARKLSAGTDDPMRAAAMAASRKFLTVVGVSRSSLRSPSSCG